MAAVGHIDPESIAALQLYAVALYVEEDAASAELKRLDKKGFFKDYSIDSLADGLIHGSFKKLLQIQLLRTVTYSQFTGTTHSLAQVASTCRLTSLVLFRIGASAYVEKYTASLCAPRPESQKVTRTCHTDPEWRSACP